MPPSDQPSKELRSSVVIEMVEPTESPEQKQVYILTFIFFGIFYISLVLGGATRNRNRDRRKPVSSFLFFYFFFLHCFFTDRWNTRKRRARRTIRNAATSWSTSTSSSSAMTTANARRGPRSTKTQSRSDRKWRKGRRRWFWIRWWHFSISYSWIDPFLVLWLVSVLVFVFLDSMCKRKNSEKFSVGVKKIKGSRRICSMWISQSDF